jgi:hypothetical protein
MLTQAEPDLDAYLRRTSSDELVWELHGVTYEARDDGGTLTLRRENRALILTMTADSPDASAATVRSSDASEVERDKWERLMALVETHAI